MSGLEYSLVKRCLELISDGKALLSKTPSIDGISVGQEFTQHIAGTYAINRYKILGFSGSELEAALYEGPRWKDVASEYSHPTTVLKDKDGHYHIWRQVDVAGAIATNKMFKDAKNDN